MLCRPVETWWHTRRNQISSFGETDESHLNRRCHQFSRQLAAEVCASAEVMLNTPCSEVVWRVLSTHSIRQRGLGWRSGWGAALLVGRSRDRFPVVSLGIFPVVPPTEPCALRSTQPLEVSTRDFCWGKGGRCVWLTTNHPCSAETSRKSGALIYPEPFGPPRSVAGHLYLLFRWIIPVVLISILNKSVCTSRTTVL